MAEGHRTRPRTGGMGSDQPLMEAAVEGNSHRVATGFAQYLQQEMEQLSEDLEGADMNDEWWAYQKGRLDQARITHSLAFMLAQALREAQEVEDDD